jgi:hypothetical protein
MAYQMVQNIIKKVYDALQQFHEDYQTVSLD